MCGLSKNVIYTTTQRATKNISAHVSHETISIQHRFPIFQTFFNQRNLTNYTIPSFLWFLFHQPIHHPLRSHITENPPADWLATQQLHWDLHDKKKSHWPMPLALLGFSIPAPLLASFRLPNPWASSFNNSNSQPFNPFPSHRELPQPPDPDQCFQVRAARCEWRSLRWEWRWRQNVFIVSAQSCQGSPRPRPKKRPWGQGHENPNAVPQLSWSKSKMASWEQFSDPVALFCN